MKTLAIIGGLGVVGAVVIALAPATSSQETFGS
jgi:hypothetical protein